MSGTMDAMASEADQQELVQQLLAQAKEQGIELVGPDRLLNRTGYSGALSSAEAQPCGGHHPWKVPWV